MKLHSVLLGWIRPDQALRVAAGIPRKHASDGLWPDDRKSQSRCVTHRIRPRRSGLEWQESRWNRFKREKQMTSDASAWCVPELSPRGAPAKPATDEYCQVARKSYDASPRCNDFIEQRDNPQPGCPWKGPSRVRGNFHARFFGGRERAIARAYPVRLNTNQG